MSKKKPVVDETGLPEFNTGKEEVEVPAPKLDAPQRIQRWTQPFPNSGQVEVVMKDDLTVSGTTFKKGEAYVVGADFAHANSKCIKEEV